LKKELYKTKRKTWEKFVNENLANNLWGIPYKIVMHKIKTRGPLNSLITDEGGYTASWRETVELLFKKLFPDDNNNEDNEENTRLRFEMNIPPNSEEDDSEILTTNDEVKVAIKSLKSGRAPGPDGVVNEIFKTNTDIWTPYLARLFNECIKQNKFPDTWKKADLIILLKGEDKDKSKPKS